jgi:hypothetical protein
MNYEFECQKCGLIMEVTERELDPINDSSGVVCCPKCESRWVTEISPGELWLEPIEEVKF